jgi:hypothetical protein
MFGYHPNSHKHDTHTKLNLLILVQFGGKLQFWSKNDPKLTKIPANGFPGYFPPFLQRHKVIQVAKPRFSHDMPKMTILGQKTPLLCTVLHTKTPKIPPIVSY